MAPAGLAAIEAARRNGSWTAPAERAVLPTAGGDVGSMTLTEREREVLRRVADGERTKEIAAHLGIAERTVKTYLSSIYTKLGVDSRTSAVARAIASGLLAPRDGASKRSST